MKNKTRNIAFFNVYEIWGGGEKWHFEMASELHAQGHRVHMFTPVNGELGRRSSEVGINVIDVKWSKNSYFNIFRVFWLIYISRKLNLEIVLFNSIFDLRDAALCFLFGGVKKRIFRVGMPIAPKNSLIYRLSFKYGLTHINYISYDIQNAIEDVFNKCLLNTKKSLFTNGIDTLLFDKVDKEKGDSPFIIGNCVRLAKQKRLDLFLEVANYFKDNKSVQFQIAGEGEERKELEKMIDSYGLNETVKLIGHLENPQKFYPTLDLVLFTSAYEGTARTILEAMACGVPVVCFDISSMKEIVESGYNGHRIPAFDVEACSKLVEILVNDPDELNRLSSNCREFIKLKFNKDVIFKNWQNLILEDCR